MARHVGGPAGQGDAAAERREAERARGRAARPPEPDWLLEGGRGRRPIYVHAGGCRLTGKHSHGINLVEARRALAEGVPACPHCRPESKLGMLEQ
ncbi:DUF6233 domain-containing protein [Streptomyces sp. CC224B]|uniref:DUF6233 domain-containing protein n=1 Tax=Streptomyces sp. CC224B TaxID=3044571 RepID=UPI0024A86EF5|nr:DUF6233 domain-containing protein [Streptomyces sp. CC224B]